MIWHLYTLQCGHHTKSSVTILLRAGFLQVVKGQKFIDSTLSGTKAFAFSYGTMAGSMLVEVCLLYKRRYVTGATPSPVPVSELSFYKQCGHKLLLGVTYMTLNELVPVFQVLIVSMYKVIQTQHSKHYVSDRRYLFKNFKITRIDYFLSSFRLQVRHLSFYQGVPVPNAQ